MNQMPPLFSLRDRQPIPSPQRLQRALGHQRALGCPRGPFPTGCRSGLLSDHLPQFLLAFGAIVALLGADVPCSAQTALQPTLQTLADNAVRETPLPAVWIAAQQGEDPPAVVAAGVRKQGDPTEATPNDLIHIGSCTKAMTAVLICRLVEQGELRWEQTVADTFTENLRKIHPDHHDANLLELLQHRSGVPANARNWWLRPELPIRERRQAVMLDSLLQPAQKDTKDGYLYSNLGYMIAGHMAEQATGKSWEQLFQESLFVPLQLTSAGFGAPGAPNRVDQPWGHHLTKGESDDAAWLPNQLDNAPALGPAGTVHLSLADWLRFSELFHKGSNQEFVSTDSLELISRPASRNGYSLGWIMVRRSWAGGYAMTHSGSNTSWMATIWIAPQKNQTFIIATNSAGEDTGELLDQWIGQVIVAAQDHWSR